MHQNTASRVKSILDELVAAFEMLKQILIINIVDLHYLVGEVLKQFLIQWQLQHRKDMGNVGGLECFFGSQIEQPTRYQIREVANDGQTASSTHPPM